MWEDILLEVQVNNGMTEKNKVDKRLLIFTETCSPNVFVVPAVFQLVLYPRVLTVAFNSTVLINLLCSP